MDIKFETPIIPTKHLQKLKYYVEDMENISFDEFDRFLPRPLTTYGLTTLCVALTMVFYRNLNDVTFTQLEDGSIEASFNYTRSIKTIDKLLPPDLYTENANLYWAASSLIEQYVIYLNLQEVTTNPQWFNSEFNYYDFILELEPSNENQHQTPNKKGAIMASIVDRNKQAALLAATITTGNVVNTKLTKLIKPKLPMLLKGYADHPIFSVVLANTVALGIKQYASDNQRANQLADAMLSAAAVKLAESFNIEEMMDELLSGVTLPSVTEE